MYRGMIIRKTPEQIDADGGGRRDPRPLPEDAPQEGARPGVTTAELDEAAEKFIRSQGAEPSFKGYRGFPGSICASPNSMVVHGIPGPYELERGDMLSIDVGVTYDGWVADAAITVPIGDDRRPRPSSCSTTTKDSLFAGIAEAVAGNHLGDISHADPARASSRRPLDDPQPRRPRHRPRHARGPADPELRRARQGPGARGGHGLRDRADGQHRRRPRSAWAPTTGPSTRQDGSLAAHFEFTVASGADGPRILTPWHVE